MLSAYTNVKNPAGLTSVEKLREETKKICDVVSKKDVEKFLSSEYLYTLHGHYENSCLNNQIILF